MSTWGVGRIIPPFFFESSESDRVFNYLHDSNSIFRARGIKSEGIRARTVTTLEKSLVDLLGPALNNHGIKISKSHTRGRWSGFASTLTDIFAVSGDPVFFPAGEI